MKKETVSFRTDFTFWLAILVLITTMLSRHVGRALPVNMNIPAPGKELSGVSK